MTAENIDQAIRPLGALERLFASYGTGGAMVFAIPVLIKGRLTALALDEALLATQSRHQLLNVKIGYSVDRQVSFVRSSQPIKTRMIKGSEVQLAELLSVEVNTPFNGETGPLMRLTAMVGDDRTILVGTFHHSIADGRSGVRVMADLLSAVGGLGLPKIAEFDALDVLLGGKLTRFSEPAAHGRVSGDSEPMPELEASVVRITEYSSQESNKIFSAAKSNGTSVHSALTVAFARAFLAVNEYDGREPYKVMSPVDLKPLIGMKDQVGAFVSIAVLPFSKTDAPFWDAARSVNEIVKASRTKEAADGFMGAITRSLLASGSFEATFPRLVRNVPYDGVMTNLGIMDVRTRYGSVVVEKMWAPALRGVPGQDTMAAATFEDRLTLVHTGGLASAELLREMTKILNAAL